MNTVQTCSNFGCDNKAHRGVGLCKTHYLHRLNADKRCLIEGCARPVIEAGYCKPHIERRRRGTLSSESSQPKHTGTWLEVFASQVRVDDNGCWQWTGHVDGRGYGVARAADGALMRAHRLAYLIAVGTLPNAPLDHMCHLPDGNCPSNETCPPSALREPLPPRADDEPRQRQARQRTERTQRPQDSLHTGPRVQRREHAHPHGQEARPRMPGLPPHAQGWTHLAHLRPRT